MKLTMGALYPGAYSSVRMSFLLLSWAALWLYELGNPPQFVPYKILKMLEHNATERLRFPNFFELIKIAEARSQVGLADRDDLLPLLSWQEIKHSDPKKKCPIVRGLSLSKSGDLFDQIVSSRGGDPVLFALLTSIARYGLLLDPARLHKLLQQRINQIVVQLAAAEDQSGRSLKCIAVSGSAEQGRQKY